MRRRQAFSKNPESLSRSSVKPVPQPSLAKIEIARRYSVPQGMDYSEMSREQLTRSYLAKFGKRPHHRMKLSTIVRNLSNDDAR